MSKIILARKQRDEAKSHAEKVLNIWMGMSSEEGTHSVRRYLSNTALTPNPQLIGSVKRIPSNKRAIIVAPATPTHPMEIRRADRKHETNIIGRVDDVWVGDRGAPVSRGGGSFQKKSVGTIKIYAISI